MPYNAKEQPALESGTDIVFSYNVTVVKKVLGAPIDCVGYPDNADTNVDNYRPRFVAYRTS